LKREDLMGKERGFTQPGRGGGQRGGIYREERGVFKRR